MAKRERLAIEVVRTKADVARFNALLNAEHTLAATHVFRFLPQSRDYVFTALRRMRDMFGAHLTGQIIAAGGRREQLLFFAGIRIFTPHMPTFFVSAYPPGLLPLRDMPSASSIQSWVRTR